MTKAKQQNRGGKRQNSGRKAIPDEQKKKQISIFVENSKVEAMGGDAKLKEFLHESIEGELKSKSFFHE